MAQKTMAEVRVSKIGFSGRPVAHVSVDKNISADQLGAIMQKVATNENILQAAGLRACLGCKSGLDFNILDYGEEVIQVEV